MIINWYGEGCFKVQTGGITIVTDLFLSSSGLTPPRFKADITLSTNTTYPLEEKPDTGNYVVGAGEYEIQGVEIKGFSINGDKDAIKTAFLVHAEGIYLGFLGGLEHLPDPKIIEELGGVDILFVPAGGKPHIEQEHIGKLIKQINPKIVVPAFYKVPGLKRNAETLDAFLKELGKKEIAEEKLTIKKKDLPASLEIHALKL
jgi:L-ascorbate metabolism protein UlaG (beta-lactamase superfamily)